MPRMCRLKPRNPQPSTLKVDKACRIGRIYSEFLDFRETHPELQITEMGSVLGEPGSKVLLTLHLTSFDFMLAFLRDQNTARSVTSSLVQLRQAL